VKLETITSRFNFGKQIYRLQKQTFSEAYLIIPLWTLSFNTYHHLFFYFYIKKKKKNGVAETKTSKNTLYKENHDTSHNSSPRSHPCTAAQ
jgi:hypothetical protein